MYPQSLNNKSLHHEAHEEHEGVDLRKHAAYKKHGSTSPCHRSDLHLRELRVLGGKSS
jgi:hypothetical protein